MTQARHSNWGAWRFSFLVALVVASIVAVSLYLSGLHSNWITLNDPTARTVAVATDLDSYKMLLWARPSPAWVRYYGRHLLPEDDPRVLFKGDIRVFRQLQSSGRIIELPNGTHGAMLEGAALTASDNPLHRPLSRHTGYAFGPDRTRVWRSGPIRIYSTTTARRSFPERPAILPLPYNAISTAVRSTCTILATAFLSATLLPAADKKLPIEDATNDQLAISASAVIDRDQIKQELGYDLGADIIVIRVALRVVSEKPVQISHDDFLLISDKDGQRSEPYEPGQIAGADSLTVTPTGMRKGGNRPGIMLGGLGGGIGSGSSTPNPEVKVEAKHDDTPNPLLAVLNEKILPEKEITDKISGLLYFQIVGKVKPKDLELHYKGPAGRMALRFKP